MDKGLCFQSINEWLTTLGRFETIDGPTLDTEI